MYRFALALALIVAAAWPAAAGLPITEEPTPAPVRGQFECPPEEVCPLGDPSGCPVEKPLCCPVPPGRRRRRLNFYPSEVPSTGCCGMPGVDDYCD